MSVDHYENFPVASLLVPARLRQPIEVIYRFARSADDIADEGDATPEERLASLAAYQAELDHIAAGTPPQTPLFVELAAVIAAHALPVQLFRDLLDAFAQDVVKKRYADYPELLDYCRRSANPVGRLVLHLFGRTEPEHLEQSDCICSALQLINFWQDIRTDVARARWYPSTEQMARFGVHDADLQTDTDNPAASRMVAAYTDEAVAMMHRGAPLALALPGRAGWELRLVVQGGLRIAEKIQAMNHATWRRRPTLGKGDIPLLVWRAWRMSAVPHLPHPA